MPLSALNIFLAGQAALELSLVFFFCLCMYTYLYSHGNRDLSCLKSVLQL